MQARQSPQRSEDVGDIRDYFAVLRRRAIVIVVFAALGLGLAGGYSLLQTRIYSATTRLLINPPPGSSGSPADAISMDTEAQLIKSASIARAVSKTLDSPLTITELLSQVSVKTTPDSFVLDIEYRDTKPAAAARGANAFAQAYLDDKQQRSDDQNSHQRAVIGRQVAHIQRLQEEQNKIVNTSTPGTIKYRDAREELDRLSVKLDVLASSLAQLPPTADPGQIILPAAAPGSPTSPRLPFNAAAGLVLGLFLGVVAAFVIDRMDDRIRQPADLELYIDAPVLAFVPHVKGHHRERASQLVVHLDPRSPVAEAYRTIRASVLSMAHERELKVFAITSPVQGEGKSMTSANIAAALAQTDKRVLVLSADIRKPALHEFFGSKSAPGLSELLEGKTSLAAAVQRSDNNLWVLAGGRFPAQPAELLQSAAMEDLLDTARSQFDFVIIDCPPVLGLADCLAVLPLVDAVILVVQADETRGGAIREVCDRLERVGVAVGGVVMNNVSVARGGPGHHNYGYYEAPQEYLRPVGTWTAPTQGPPTYTPPRPVTSAPNTNHASDAGEGFQRGVVGRERTNPPGSSSAPKEASRGEALAPSTIPADEN